MKKETVTGKRLLILGAGRGQLRLYEAARSLGIHTIAGTMPGSYLPCLPFADEVCYMDVSDPDDVVSRIRESGLKPDGVATCCMDTGIRSLGRVCDSFGLTGLCEEAAVLCNDKWRMKEALEAHGVTTAQYRKVSDKTQALQAISEIGLPVVVKAVDMQGSQGVYICRTKEEALASFDTVMSLTRRDYCIMEMFIEGDEFGAQAFVYDGEVFFVMPHGDDVFNGKTGIPIGHYVPFDADKNLAEQAETQVRRAIAALGLNNCAVNADFIRKDDKIYVIELTGRAGANCLVELTQAYYGIEYYKMIAVTALGEDPSVYWEQRRRKHMPALSQMIISTEKSGILESDLSAPEATADADVLEITFFKKSGDEIRKFENSNDCIGQIVVAGCADVPECRLKASRIVKSIEINIKGNKEI